ncbi:MAG TPA: flagellar biosynthetic protein FliO [Spirochaetota bacterium]|nr:flagellar biosynthetic protein FliO [Spirochaetota bacterium]HPP03767.1 flagellar biosynthetic protein FliO [Spirochaetota bacterium]
MEKRSNLSSDKDNKKIKIDYFAYIRIILVLAVVLGIIYGLFIFLKKSLKIKDDTSEGATVIVSHSLGPGKWVQVVFVGGKYLILGITNENINLLGEITDPKEIERYEIYLNQRKSEDGHSFRDIISDFFKKKSPKKEFDYESDSIDFLKKQRERLNNNDE